MKLVKTSCEICGESNKNVIDFHHIIPQSEINSTNHNTNIAIICSNCHRKVHSDEIIIFGVLPSTNLPNKRTLVYSINGIKNIDVDITYNKIKKTEKI